MESQPIYPTYPSQPGNNQNYGSSVNQAPPPYQENPLTSQPNNPQSAAADMFSGGSYETGIIAGIDSGFSFSEQSIRLAFVRKVFAILSVQLAVTLGFIAMFVYNSNANLFFREHPEMCWIAFLMTFVLLIVLACYNDFRRRYPLNLIFLGLFTLCEGFMLGAVSSLYDTEDVVIAVGICMAVCLALILFSMQTKYDFTASGGILFVCSVILVIFGFVAITISVPILHLIYACLGALLFSVYLVFDTQLMLGGKHKCAISPEEYIFAALNLYLDIVNIFLNVLALVGGSRH